MLCNHINLTPDSAKPEQRQKLICRLLTINVAVMLVWGHMPTSN